MSLQALQRRLIEDLKSSWKKTAILGVLLLVGLFLWIPHLIGSNKGGKQPAQTPAVPANGGQAVNRQSTSGNSPTARSGNQQKSSSNPGLSWEQLEELAATNSLVQSVEVSAFSGNPFRVNSDQFSPPVLFTKLKEDKTKQQAAQLALKSVRDFTGLVLKSTMVNPRRRAALINRSLYFEGSQIEFEGETYTIQSVHPRKVVLRQGKQVWMIGLNETKATNRIEVERLTADETKP